MLLLSTLLNAIDLGIHQFFGSYDNATTMYQIHRTIFFLFYKLYTLFQLYPERILHSDIVSDPPRSK